jgi:hypothetical protein
MGIAIAQYPPAGGGLSGKLAKVCTLKRWFGKLPASGMNHQQLCTLIAVIKPLLAAAAKRT